MTGTLFSWIIAAISAAGYAGVIGLMAIEPACIPLPSEVIMPFSGYLVSTGRFSLPAVALAVALGCNVGSTAHISSAPTAAGEQCCVGAGTCWSTDASSRGSIDCSPAMAARRL